MGSHHLKYIKKRKSWIILGVDEHGNYVGYTEHSFSMGRSIYDVRVWRDTPNYSGKFDSLKKTAKAMLKEEPEMKWAIYRVGSKNCPVKINWGKFWQLGANGKTRPKYNWRNLSFVRR